MSVYDKSEGTSFHFDVPFFVYAAARGYSGSATVLFRKRYGLIPEALGSYFGNAMVLFRKSLALILEEPGSYFGSARLLFDISQALP